MKSIKLSLLIVALLAAAGVQAQKAGDTIVGVGWAFVRPDASLSPGNTVSPAPYGAVGAGVTAAYTGSATATINNTSTLSVSVLRMLTDNIGAELSVGSPPKLTVNMVAGGVVVNEAATAKALTPALVAKYFFLEPSSSYRPYLGFGVTHAQFSNVSPRVSNPLVAELAGTSASLGSTWAPVYNAGLIYNINDKWSVNASVSYIPLTSAVTFQGVAPVYGGVPITTTTKLTMNPTDYVIRLGYKF